VSDLRFAAVLAAASTVLLLPAAAQAQQVTGLEVRQDDGFATLSWDPVAGATEYDIERTPVGAPGTGVVVGVWRPNRQINQDSPAFADAGFNPGDSFQWRVRARFGTEPQPYSAPVSGTTQPEFGDPATPGENLRTGWEEDNAATFTSDVEEYAYTAALDAASERVRVVEIGRTVLGRPINMFIIGYPTPKPTAQAVAGNPAALVHCNVHGNEPSSREACLIMARKLAFADDPRTLDLLSNMTVLIVPAINGDGRAANTRGNSTGQDLNRDHSLIRQPETFALAAIVRDYTPEAAFDGHEFGNSQAGDLPTLMPRHLNVAEPIFLESKDMIENWLYVNGSQDGWWYCPYGCQGGGAVGLSQETILRNTLGLKNMVSLLLEAHSAGGQTRPNEAIPANNRRRKTYSALYTYHQFLDYYPAAAARDRACDRGVTGLPAQQHRPDRVPGQLRRPGLPRAAPRRGPAAPGAARGHPRPAAVRLPADRRAVHGSAARRPTGCRPPGGARHQGPAARAGSLVRADAAGPEGG
jgi:Zinc carboxypeptidase